MKKSSTLALMLFLSLPMAAQADDEIVGYVKTAEGVTTVRRADGLRDLEVGSPLYEGDVVVTGAESSLGFVFKDGTAMTAGAETTIAIDDFAYLPAKQDFGLAARVSQGTVDFVSGLLGKDAPESVSVATPSGVIGIRGTHFAVEVKPSSKSAAWLAETTPRGNS